MSYIVGASKHLHLVSESTWGTFPGVPTYLYLPVLDYNVRLRNDRRNADPFAGTFQRRHGKNFRGMPSGTLVTHLYGNDFGSGGNPICQDLLDWAFGSHESAETPSYSAEWAEGPNLANKRHVGLRVNAATLSGSSDAGTIELSIDLMGKDESGDDVVTTAQTPPNDQEGLFDFEFADAVLTFDGSPVAMDNFSLTAQYNLQAKYLASTRPTLIVKTTRVLQFSFTPPKEDDTFDAYRRATTANEFAGTLALRGLDAAGSSTYITASIAMPRMSFIDADEQGGKSDLAMQALTFDLLKPDSASNELTITHGTA